MSLSTSKDLQVRALFLQICMTIVIFFLFAVLLGLMQVLTSINLHF